MFVEEVRIVPSPHPSLSSWLVVVVNAGNERIISQGDRVSPTSVNEVLLQLINICQRVTFEVIATGMHFPVFPQSQVEQHPR
jgi:hypothetical protein